MELYYRQEGFLPLAAGEMQIMTGEMQNIIFMLL